VIASEGPAGNAGPAGYAGPAGNAGPAGRATAAGSGTAALRPIVLIGAPGAGKTTVGTVLAARLGVGFADTDAIVESAAGKPVSDIFITDGEPAFRRLEREAVAAALAAGDSDPAGEDARAGEDVGAGANAGAGVTGANGGAAAPVAAVGVVGLGGGAVMDEQTQARLAGRRVVYLATGFAELAKRVGLDRARPLLIGTNPRAQLKSLLDQRLPVYDKLAWLTVSTDGRDPGEIAAEIADAVERAATTDKGAAGEGAAVAEQGAAAENVVPAEGRAAAGGGAAGDGP
jgi:shikimate kinase